MANDDTTTHTDGGASVGNNVQTNGGAFVGRDQINFIVPLGQWAEIRRVLFKDKAQTGTYKATEEQFETFDWSKAEQAYLNKVIKLYNRVRILGTSDDVPLGNIFTQVYVFDKPIARQRLDIEELHKQGWNRFDSHSLPGQRMRGLDLVKTNRNLFILGKPGAGKTTFLKYITIQAARKDLPRIPIFVSLNQWADSQWGKGDKAALLPFIVEQLAICDFPDAELFIDYLLAEGRALVLFDGLDEVKQENKQRYHLTRLLQNFSTKYDKSQYLITCRIAATDYTFSGFADVEVADFTPNQVREYAGNWFGEKEKKFDAFITELEKKENKGLAELCNTPLLLSLLCLTFDNNMRFPPNRAELYEDALETLLRKWDTNREIQRDEIYRMLSHKRKLQLLMGIAVPTFEKGQLFFRKRDLERWIVDYLAKLPEAPPVDSLDGTAILKAIESQHGVLVERAQGIYSFSHLTFQEYLTARYIAENRGKVVISRLIDKYLTDGRWREVFLLTASLLDDADEFINAMNHITGQMIADRPEVIRLVAWAHKRTTQVTLPVELQQVVQLAYIFLAYALDMNFTSILGSTSPDVFTRNMAYDRASLFESKILNMVINTVSLADELLSAYDSEHKYTNILMPLCNQMCQLSIYVGRTLETRGQKSLFSIVEINEMALLPKSLLKLVFEFASKTVPLIGFDYGLSSIWIYATLFANKNLDYRNEFWPTALQQFRYLVEGVIGLAKEAGLTNPTQQLVIKSAPSPKASRQAWQQYADALFTIMHNDLPLGSEWNMNQKEQREFEEYFYVNKLLVQCLRVAVVSGRHTVLSELLLPPKDIL